jgi:peptidyl-prolyl cis-trans isomerase SurA
MSRRLRFAALLLLAAVALPAARAQQPSLRADSALRAPAAQPSGDSIAAIVNTNVITRLDVQRRMRRIEAELQARRTPLPPRAELEKLALDALIDEQVQVTWAADQGITADDFTLERAIASVAAQNNLSMPEFIKRVEQDCCAFAVYREQLRDEIVISRLRDRELLARAKVSEAEIDDFIAEQSGVSGADRVEYNVAQLLVAVPEDAPADVVAQRREKAERLLQQLRDGADFAKLSAEQSDASNAKEGGELGFRTLARLPDAFVNVVKPMKTGDYAGPVRTGAGFHVLLLKAKKTNDLPGVVVPVTHARHILLKGDTPQNRRLLTDLRYRIMSNQITFEQAARQYSQDGSAEQGGDLGTQGPGVYVPEFQQAMDALKLGELSEPVPTRYGVHLIQVLERKQQQLSPKDMREQSREILRQRKALENVGPWLADLRSKAYIEVRRD